MDAKVLLIFAVLLAGGYAIKCYQCTYNSASSSGSDCKSHPVAEKYLRNCSSAITNCSKVVSEVSEKTSIVRKCGASVSGCVGSICTYNCKTDGCNSSSSVKISLLIMIGNIALGFLLTRF